MGLSQAAQSQRDLWFAAREKWTRDQEVSIDLAEMSHELLMGLHRLGSGNLGRAPIDWLDGLSKLKPAELAKDRSWLGSPSDAFDHSVRLFDALSSPECQAIKRCRRRWAQALFISGACGDASHARDGYEFLENVLAMYLARSHPALRGSTPSSFKSMRTQIDATLRDTLAQAAESLFDAGRDLGVEPFAGVVVSLSAKAAKAAWGVRALSSSDWQQKALSEIEADLLGFATKSKKPVAPAPKSMSL